MLNNNILLLIIILICVALFYKKNRYESFITYTSDFKKFHKDYGFEMKNNYLIYKNGKKIPYTKTLNNPESLNLTKNKSLTKKILNKYNIPTPQGLIYNKEVDNIDDFIKNVKYNLKFPLVIKPTNMSNAIDVYVNINSLMELKNKMLQLKNKYKKLIIEEMIKGDLYRILMINHNIIDVLIRKNAFIISNGVNSIKELIDIKNIKIKKINNEELKILKEIKKVDLKNLKKQGYELDDIPEKGIKIFVSAIPDIKYGRILDRIKIEDIHPDNIKLFKKISKVFNIVITGIDYISKDISKSYKETGIVLELNSNPIYVSHKIEKDNYSIIKKILKNLENYFKSL